MAYKVKKADCSNCGTCEDTCPNEAISEKDDARWIDPDKCVDCGSCEGDCPSNAIVQA